MKYQVFIRLKGSVLDVQGKAVEQGLSSVGISNVKDIRIGKLVEFEVEAADRGAAVKTIEELCRRVLANPVMESYEIREVG